MSVTDTIDASGIVTRAGDGCPLCPYVFVSFSCDHPLEKTGRFALQTVDRVDLERGDLLSATRSERRLALQLPDRRVSSAHSQIVRVLDGFLIEDQGSKNGTFVNGERIDRRALVDGDIIEVGHTLLLYRARMPSPIGTPDDLILDGNKREVGLATLNPELESSFARLAMIARSTLPVLVTGESGTGKELVARAIHTASGRAGDLVAVNCGALPATLVESSLFGHERGAFSGAEQARVGLVRSAESGTLFLDEIGDLALSAQAAILRLLEAKEVMPVGASRPTTVDVRFVSATHRDLDALAASERFRTDLIARLRGYAIHLPPLRERREDLPVITATLLSRITGAANELRLAPAVARALLRAPFPLNVRELEKLLSAACIVADGRPLTLDHFPALTGPAPTAPTAAPAAAPVKVAPLTREEEARKLVIIAHLQKTGGNVTRVAQTMGKARVQIQRWLKRYGLKPEDYR